MPAWWVVPAAIKGGETLLNFWVKRKNKIPKLQNTEYGRMLQKQSNEGIYSPTVQRNIMTQSGVNTGSVAAQQRAGISGMLESQGMGRSIAGVRMKNEPYMNQMRTMGDISRNVQTANELSKADAKRIYAQALMENEMARKGQNVQDYGELASGLASAGMAAIQGYQDKLEGMEDKQLERILLLLQSGQTDEALKLLGITGITKKPKSTPNPQQFGDY